MKNVQELRISIQKGMIIVKTYQIHLIRHGLTDGNTQGRYIGRTDLPLSGEGIRELKNLAEKYEYPRAELYYTSPMLRCIQTMNLLYPGTDCFEVPGLREVDFGKWEGKTAQELSDDPLVPPMAGRRGDGGAAGRRKRAGFFPAGMRIV